MVENKLIARRALGVVAMLVLVLGAALVFTGSATAQVQIGQGCFQDRYGPKVCPSETTKDPDNDVDADILERGSSSRETLPFTGADLTLFVVTGGALVATGALVVRRARAGRNEN